MRMHAQVLKDSSGSAWSYYSIYASTEAACLEGDSNVSVGHFGFLLNSTHVLQWLISSSCCLLVVHFGFCDLLLHLQTCARHSTWSSFYNYFFFHQQGLEQLTTVRIAIGSAPALSVIVVDTSMSWQQTSALIVKHVLGAFRSRLWSEYRPQGNPENLSMRIYSS